MSEIVWNCPRCNAKRITFDVLAGYIIDQRYGWQNRYELSCCCRQCHRASILIVAEDVDGDYEYVHKTGLLKINSALNRYVRVEGHVSHKDEAGVLPPEHVPPPIEAIFKEGATCYAVRCYNAAGTMFRLCVDLATRERLPDATDPASPPHKIRRDLGLRLRWLFENDRLPKTLEELSACIREDGNDGAHAGTLEQADAEDLLDFSATLLERLYTEPERLRLAKERRDERRDPKAGKKSP